MIPIIIISIIFIVAIIWLNMSPRMEESPETFLNRLAKLTEGTVGPLVGFDNAYQLAFTFEKQNFVFEDIQIKTEKEIFWKGFLKAETGTTFTLQFTEKKYKNISRSSNIPIIAQSKDDSHSQSNALNLPGFLKDIDVYTNDISLANRFFEDKKASHIISQFKNVSLQGHPFVSFKVLDGTVILEFYPSAHAEPNLQALKRDIYLFENYLDALLVTIHQIKSLSMEK